MDFTDTNGALWRLYTVPQTPAQKAAHSWPNGQWFAGLADATRVLYADDPADLGPHPSREATIAAITAHATAHAGDARAGTVVRESLAGAFFVGVLALAALAWPRRRRRGR
jgi:hypothetical protein